MLVLQSADYLKADHAVPCVIPSAVRRRLCFVADLRFYLRWVASEHNNVDGPSRDMRRPGVDAWAAAKARAKARAKAVWNTFAESTASSA